MSKEFSYPPFTKSDAWFLGMCLVGLGAWFTFLYVGSKAHAKKIEQEKTSHTQ